MSYDSRPDTWAHIHTVQGYMLRMVAELTERAWEHDQSKLVEPELSVFNEFSPKLRDSTYGSDEYKGFLREMGKGLEHHYNANAHHPEHGDGTLGWMDLLQLVELLCDWKAATERHANGDLDASITANAARFSYGPEIERLLRNTAASMGWLSPDASRSPG